MKVLKAKIRGSAFLGVFCAVSEKTGLFPKNTPKKELEFFASALEIEAIPASAAESSVLGALTKINNEKVVVPEIVEKEEVKEMEQNGLEVEVVKGNLALGNLITLSNAKAIISPVLEPKQKNQIEKGLGVKAKQMTIAGTDIVGGSVLANKNGFAINPNAGKKEFAEVQKYFGLQGKACTANYGDHFVANSVLANSKAIIVGEYTSNIEIARLQEALGE